VKEREDRGLEGKRGVTIEAEGGVTSLIHPLALCSGRQFGRMATDDAARSAVFIRAVKNLLYF
jgi:hypothetical protein